MQKIYFLISFIVLSQLSFAQNKQQTLSNSVSKKLAVSNKSSASNKEDIEYEKYLKKDFIIDFFKGAWDDETNTCKWKNELATEADKINVYANVDTIINYTSEHEQRKIVIINSYPKNDGVLMNSCHACTALLSLIELKKEINSTKWVIESYNKSAEEQPQSHDYELLKLWDNKFCLLVHGGWAGMGYETSGVSFFLNAKEQCSATTSESFLDIFSDKKSKNYSNETKIRVDKTKKQIVLHRYGTEYNEKSKRLQKVNDFSRYILKNDQIIKL